MQTLVNELYRNCKFKAYNVFVGSDRNFAAKIC